MDPLQNHLSSSSNACTAHAALRTDLVVAGKALLAREAGGFATSSDSRSDVVLCRVLQAERAAVGGHTNQHLLRYGALLHPLARRVVLQPRAREGVSRGGVRGSIWEKGNGCRGSMSQERDISGGWVGGWRVIGGLIELEASEVQAVPGSWLETLVNYPMSDVSRVLCLERAGRR